MPKFILNASPLTRGGALQACVSFILETLQSHDSIQWSYILSPEIAKELAAFGVDIQTDKDSLIIDSPARNKRSKKAILDYVTHSVPDAVFTFFGPAYLVFPCPHLLGVADCWITHSTILAVKKKGGPTALLRFILLYFYKKYWFRKADHWVVEARCAQQGLIKRFGMNKENISIVPNNCGNHYHQPLEPNNHLDCHNILVFSSYYPHKQLEIIPKVAKYLRHMNPNLSFRFILTINKNAKETGVILKDAETLGVSEHILNVGPVEVQKGPSLYADAALTFMPTLLETFSAVYPESMKTGTPIVTTDLNFARDVCQDAARYFEPLNALDAAEKINEVLTQKVTYDRLVQRGHKIVDALPSQTEKYSLYKSALLKISDVQKSPIEHVSTSSVH